MAQIAPTGYFTCGVMLDSAEEGWSGLALCQQPRLACASYTSVLPQLPLISCGKM